MVVFLICRFRLLQRGFLASAFLSLEHKGKLHAASWGLRGQPATLLPTEF